MHALTRLLPLVAFATGAALAADPALAADDAAAVADERKPEEVVVYADAFARWDGTRWFVDTQIGLPSPLVLFGAVNTETEIVAVELKTVIACDKTWRRSKSRHEVDCTIEDIGVQAAGWRAKEPHAAEILAEIDARLSQARIQLIVSDDGRLTNIDLEEVEGDNDREKAIREQARMLLVRAMVGFHMKLPPRRQIRQGQWLEYDSTLFAIPVAEQRRSASNSDGKRSAVVVNSISGSYVIHQLDRYKGHLVVQSVGEGSILVGDDDTGDESFFKVKLDGVAIYGPETGIMTERVWSLHGRTTAGSFLGDGRVAPIYFHNGRIRMLDEDEQVDVGPTRRVSRPGAVGGSLPDWQPLK